MSKSSLLSRALRAHVTLCWERPWLVIGVMAVVLLLAGSLASQLGFKGDFIELLPQQSPEVVDLHFVESKAGGAGYLITQVTGGEQMERRRLAARLAEQLERETALVRYVEYRFDMQFFRSRALYLLPTSQLEALHDDVEARILYEKRQANPLFVDVTDEAPPPDFDALAKKYTSSAPQSEYIESKDGTELYLYVKPTGQASDLDYDRRLIAAGRAAADRVLPEFPRLKVDFTGPFVIRVEEDETMQRDLKLAGVLAAVFALGFIVLATRRLAALPVAFIPVSLGIAVTFAFAKLSIGHLNPVTGFLGAILVGLGIEYGIHLSMRYWEEREQLDVHQALEAAVVGTFTGALTSAATNAVAFLVLVFAQFEAFKQFGRIAGFGVLATVIAAYALGPAVLVVAERVRPLRRRESLTAPGRDWPRLPSGLLVGVLAAVIGFAGYSATVARHVGFETDLRRLKGDSPATALDDHITKQLGIIMAPALLYVNDLNEAEQVARVVDEVSKARGEATSFQQVASLNDMLPRDVSGHRRVIGRLQALVADLPKSMLEGEQKQKVDELKAMLDVEPWAEAQVPFEVRRRFSALEGGGTFVLLFPRYSGYDTDELELWAEDLNEVVARAKQAGLELHVLDGNRLAARIFRLIRTDGPFILGAAAVVVFVMIWVSLRKLSQALLVATPLFLGMVCVLGGMHLLDVRLNFLNVVVLPNLLTIAVDNSIHLYHRYREEGPGSMGHVWRTTGFAAIIATLSNAAGYGAMFVAHHEGLRSVAVLAVLGVACTFSGTTLFFPATLELLERWRARRRPTATA